MYPHITDVVIWGDNRYTVANFMVILETVVCADVKLYWKMQRSASNILSTEFILIMVDIKLMAL